MKRMNLLLAVLLFTLGAALGSGRGVKAANGSRENTGDKEVRVGLQTVKQSDGEKDYYYYDDSGKKKKNVLIIIRVNGQKERYYFGKDGKAIKNRRITLDGHIYYFKKNGRAAVGSCKIGDKYLLFNEKGRLFKPRKTALVEVNGKKYIVGPKGEAVNGWVLFGKKSLYYASKSGLVQTGTKIEGIKLSKSGKAVKNTNSKLKIILMKTVARITRDDMTKKEKLRACWKYCVKRSRFSYALKYPNLNKKGWYRKTAENMLRTKSGNCYSFACAFAALAREIGYKPYVICGRVHGSRDNASDGYTRHAWVKIKKKYYDPEAQWKGWHSGIYGRRSYPVSHKDTRKVKFEYE